MKNKLLFGLIALLLVPFALADPATWIPGDCNGDLGVSGPDFDRITSYIAGSGAKCDYYDESGNQFIWSDPKIPLDVNSDTNVDILDANIINQVIGGTYVFTYTTVSSCQPFNLYYSTMSDDTGIFPSALVAMPCDYETNYVLTNTGECQPDSTQTLTMTDINYISTSYSDYTYDSDYTLVQECTYTAPSSPSGGGGGGGGGSDNHPPVVTSTPAQETRTLEQPEEVEQPTVQESNEATGAVTAGSTDITNYALGGVVGLAVIVAGLFLWKKYK